MGFITIEQAQLKPLMEQCVRDLLAVCPWVKLTSGTRNLAQQASAMAANIVATKNRQWIEQTYRKGHLLQYAVDFHPEVTTRLELAELLRQTLVSMSSEELAEVSDHFAGHAVDLQPLEVQGVPTAEGQKVLDFIRACDHTTSILTREAGLVRWHWACKPKPRQITQEV